MRHALIETEGDVFVKVQTMHLGSMVVRYELGDTWFDGSLHVSMPCGSHWRDVRLEGTDTVVALRDFLNSLDFKGRKFVVVPSGPRSPHRSSRLPRR